MGLYDHFTPIAFQLSPERQKALMDQYARDLKARLPADLLKAYPKMQMPGMVLPDATTRLARYTQQTVPEDFPLIRNPEFVKQYKAGVMPPPVSPFWNKLLGLPDEFERVQRDFNEVYNRLVDGE